MSDKIYQYAVKVIQGGIKVDSKTTPIGPGIYFTSVNVHNPWRHDVKYAVKLAVSGPNGRPGTVSPFQRYKLGPDQATEYDYLGFDSLLPPIPSFLESFFVIESEEELDVVGVYTGAAVQDKRLGAMHMERVPARQVSRCKDFKMDMSTGVAQWQLTQVPPSSTSPMVVGPAPVVSSPPGAWAAPPNTSVKWLGSGTSVKAGKYTYELNFCLCWTFQNARMDIKLWTDNEAEVFLNTTQIGTTPHAGYGGPGTPINNITSGFQVGMNAVEVVVKNTEGPSGMMLQGSLSANAADCEMSATPGI